MGRTVSWINRIGYCAYGGSYLYHFASLHDRKTQWHVSKYLWIYLLVPQHEKLNKKLLIHSGALAQLARAPVLHAGGDRFDSDMLHQKNIKIRRKAVFLYGSFFSCFRIMSYRFFHLPYNILACGHQPVPPPACTRT